MTKQTEKTQEDLEEDARDTRLANELGADAVFHVRNAAAMTEEGKLAIAEWLRHQAEQLLAEGHNYAVIYTARYNPEKGTER